MGAGAWELIPLLAAHTAPALTPGIPAHSTPPLSSISFMLRIPAHSTPHLIQSLPSPLPAVFFMLRNLTPPLRSFSMGLYGWLGCITLETCE